MRPNPRTAGALAGLLLVALPAAAAGQRCHADTTPDHDDWHERVRAEQRLRDGIEAAAAERGVELSGTVSVTSDTAPPRTEIEYGDGFAAPASFVPVVRGHLSAHLLDLPLAERDLELDFDRPRIPLWPDSTVHCEPAATNDGEIQRKLRTVMENHPEFRDGSMPLRSYRASLWLFVGPTGGVEKVEVRKPTGDPWFDGHLEEIGETMSFEPASLNGVPLGVWVSRNVTFRLQEGRRQPYGRPSHDRPPPGGPPDAFPGPG